MVAWPWTEIQSRVCSQWSQSNVGKRWSRSRIVFPFGDMKVTSLVICIHSLYKSIWTPCFNSMAHYCICFYPNTPYVETLAGQWIRKFQAQKQNKNHKNFLVQHLLECLACVEHSIPLGKLFNHLVLSFRKTDRHWAFFHKLRSSIYLINLFRSKRFFLCTESINRGCRSNKLQLSIYSLKRSLKELFADPRCQ